MKNSAAAPEATMEGTIRQPDGGVFLSQERLEEYLESMAGRGCTAETVKSYRLRLRQLYEFLPEDKTIRAGTLDEWQAELTEAGYLPSTINICTAAANGYVTFFGRRELQVEKPLKRVHTVQPELTRNEYLRLLSAARHSNKQQSYLLVKVFATMGLSIIDLPRLTVEAVEQGAIVFPKEIVHIPECLRPELLDYIQRQRISSGPVFVNKSGSTLGRTYVTKRIQSLCRDAQVPEEKANPRCLRKLYQTTRAGIQANLSLLLEQAHDRLLETEQLAIGWAPDES